MAVAEETMLCRICFGVISAGQAIVLVDRKWVHEGCAPEEAP